MYTPLTQEEEQEYFKRIRNGDQKSFDDFVMKNEKLVYLVAKKYRFFYFTGFTQEDLVQEGYLGLIKAVNRFDGSAGNKFSTYAMKVINSFILRAIRKHSKIVSVPERQIHNAKKLSEEKNISISELFKETYNDDYDKNFARALAVMQDRVFSLNEPVEEGRKQSSSFADILMDDNSFNPRQKYSDVEILKKISSVLNERELNIVANALGLNKDRTKLSDIGRQIGLTRERVRQILQKALEKITVFLKEEQ